MPIAKTKRSATVQDAPSVFTATYQTAWMENHRPVQPLGSQSALDTAITSEGQPILFSYDATFSFQATVAADGSASGWTNYSIGEELASNSGGVMAGFQVSQATKSDGSPGAITVLAKMIINAGQDGSFVNGSSSHQLWLLSGMDNAADAAWLSDSTQRNWTQLPYSGGSIPGVTAATLQVADLRVLEVAPDGIAGCGLVHVVGAGGVLQSFLLDITGSDPTDAWTYVAPETSFTSLTAAGVGAPRSASAVGLYKLYPNPVQVAPTPAPGSYVRNGPMLLSFLQPGAAAIFFPILSTGTASAIATLPAGSYEGLPVTDLFVSDGPNLNLYVGAYDYSGNVPNQQPPAPWPNPITIANASWLTGCTELFAATDGKVVSLWGLTGGGSVFHIQAPYAKRDNPAEWSAPVLMMSNVSLAAIHISKKRGLTSMFAVQNQPAPTATTAKPGRGLRAANPSSLNAYSPFGSNGPSLYELHKDHLVKTPRPGGQGMVRGNSHWRKRPIHLPADANYLTLQTYTHSIQFADQYGNPASNQTVKITTTATTVIEINGQILTVTSENGATCTTDVKGCIELLQDGSSVTAPTLTLTLATGSNPSTVTIDPTAPVRTSMVANIDASSSATNGIQSQSWYKLPADTTLQDVQAAANQAASAQVQSSAVQRARYAQAMAYQGVGEDAIGAFFGDVWHAICEAVEAVTAVGVSVLDGIATLTITIGNDVANFVLNTYEDICAALSAIANFLGAAVNDLFQWLAFIFNWDNIIAIQSNLLAFNSAIFNSIPTFMTAGCTAVASELTSLAGNVSSFDTSTLPATSVQSNNQSNNNLQQAQTLPANTPPGNAPQMSWGQSQLSISSGATGARLRSAPKMPGDINDLLSEVVSAIGNLIATVGTDLVDVADNTMTLQAAGQSVLTASETAIADILNDLASAVSQAPAAVNPVIQSLVGTLTSPIDIPLFTQLYADATNGGQLSLLSLASLIEAVPCAFVYAAVAPGQPAANFLSAEQLKALQNTISAANQTNAVRLGRAKGHARRLGDGQPSATAAYLRLALGVLHCARTISAVALDEATADEAQKPAIVDCVVWCLEATADMWIDYAETGEAEAVSWANAVLAALALLNAWTYDEDESDGVSLQQGCASFSIVAGVWELAVGIPAIENANGSTETLAAISLTGYGTNETLEFVEQVARNLNAKQTIEYVFGARVALMLASGIVEAGAGAAELSAATSATKAT